VLADAFREEWGRLVATLVGFCGDVDVAEDAAQEAFAAAARRWPVDGEPDSPRAWLVTTAKHAAVDRLRRERRFADRLHLLADPPASEEVDHVVPDERLELLLLCCHPALAQDARVALTLRTLGGLSTPEIARAFLVPDETMKRRLTRARTKIRLAGVPFRVPGEDLLAARLDTALAVLYLIFNQGWGDGRPDLATEAIRLTRTLVALLPHAPDPHALLALMLLHDSRRAARVRDGEVVPLAEQDRSLWDVERADAGRAALTRAVVLGARGPYAVQAAIAELQTGDPVDWESVAGLYGRLAALTRSPVVELNRAVAVAETSGPAAALALVDALELDGYRYLHSTRAELLRRLGDGEAARSAYLRAIELTTTGPEERFLRRRLAELPAPPASAGCS
jgi:RNA polymerase sigma-70 factor, ECF subfamily